MNKIVLGCIEYTEKRYRGFKPHIGLASLQSILRLNGISSEQIKLKSSLSVYETALKISEYNSDVFGFTIYDTSYHINKLIIKRLKQFRPDSIIVIGGPSATFSDIFILNDIPEIDVCVRGDGEYVLPNLIYSLKKNESLSKILGITWRKDGNIVRNPNGSPYSLDNYTSPFVSGLISPVETEGVLTSRGCSYKCIFCNFSAMTNHTVRYYPIKVIIDELLIYQKEAVLNNRIYNCIFYDDIFTLNKKRTLELCDYISKINLGNLRLWTQTRADLLDEELLVALKRAGFELGLNIGIESMMPHVLFGMNKIPNSKGPAENYKREKKYINNITNIFEIAKNINFKISPNVLFGLPNESLTDAKKTLDFIDNLACKTYSHNVLRIYRGTEIFNRKDELGYKVYNGPQGLPLITEHQYNTYEVPLLRNKIDTIVDGYEELKDIIFTSIEGSNSNETSFSIILMNTEINASFVEWINTFIPIDTCVISFQNNNKKYNNYEILSLFKEMDCPLSYYTSIQQNQDDNSIYEVHWNNYISYLYRLIKINSIEDLKCIDALNYSDKDILWFDNDEMPKCINNLRNPHVITDKFDNLVHPQNRIFIWPDYSYTYSFNGNKMGQVGDKINLYANK